jgi:hypothetical protein
MSEPLGKGEVTITWTVEYQANDGLPARVTIQGRDLWEVLRQASVILRQLEKAKEHRRGGER